MNVIKKWYTYQKERFPVLALGIYILSIVIAVFFYANNCCNETINYMQILPMFVVSFLHFLMVRIVDEFKDYEEDCKYRPYRPVPRGLVTLKELRVLFIICFIIQITTMCVCSKTGILYSVLAWLGLWVFFGLMTKSYFIKKYLEKHIVLEVILDELMMPIMMICISTLTNMPEIMQLVPLLILGYCASAIIEVARKIRSKENEENGVKTYTAVLGIPKAILLLQTFETFFIGTQIYIAYKFNNIKLIIIQSILYIILSIFNMLFVKKQTKKYAKMAELMANLGIIITYISMIFIK